METLRTTYMLSGMHCAGCAAQVEQRVSELPGVMKATINFGASNLIVEGVVNHDKVIKEAEKEGVTAKPMGVKMDEDVPKSFVQAHKDSIITGAATVLFLAGWLLGLSGYKVAEVTLLVLSIVIGGYKTARSGLYGLRKLNFDMNVLMTIAVIGAFAIGAWIEAALVVIFFSLSNTLSVYTLEKARNSIKALMGLAPREATLIRNGQEIRLDVEEIQIDDVMIVKPGEKIAMDGVIVKGASSVNQAAITGESMPVEKGIGDEVFAATINQQGSIQVKVTKRVEDTTLAKIIHLVQEAQGQRAKSQEYIDKFSKIYTPVVIVLAVLIAVVPPLFFGSVWSDWIYRGLALLIAACPCALVISSPVSIISAIGNAAKNGVLIKGGVFLEEAGVLKAIALDKTGTLTVGRPEVTDIIPANGVSEREFLEISAALERYSEHPLAAAIVRRAERDKIVLPEAEDFSAITGKGAQGTVNGVTYYIGNPRLFNDLETDIHQIQKEIERLQNEGKTAMILGTKERVIGVIAVADEVRESSKQAIARLKEAGIKRTIMLTGDNQATAKAIAEKIGVDEYRAELLPEDKVAAVVELQRKYGKIAMVGDGINDAPALATSNVGVAMGVAGTDAALETADIALMADDLTKLPFTIRLSRATVRNIKQNIWFSNGINILTMILIVPGYASLLFVALADVVAAVLVVLNAMRLLKINPTK
ncbi:heavy metal translocating P-type ATPase [Paenibacillus humicus]|uniref:heavy metal translocating P-type ATPase n=1 Tax=Paenibacillus humicus TaxID=412861 RepID=UPI003F5CD51E